MSIPPKNREMNFFDKANDWIESVEGSFVTLITTLIPWLAPALPAYLTYYHLDKMSLGIPWYVSIMMAAAVEFLGLSAVSSAFQAMRHNRQKDNRRKSNRVSVAFPVGAYVFYMAVVITINVVLELPISAQAHKYAEIASVGLLTLISAPAFVIVIVRQDRRYIESQNGTDNDTRIVKPVSLSDTNGNGYGKMTIDEIMEKEGVSRRTAYRRKERSHG